MKILYIIPYWIWMLLSIGWYCAGEIYSKKLVTQTCWEYTAMVLVSYAICGGCWIPVMLQKNQIIVQGMVWSILSIISTVLIGLYFKEGLSTCNWIGVFLGGLAIIFLSI